MSKKFLLNKIELVEIKGSQIMQSDNNSFI